LHIEKDGISIEIWKFKPSLQEEYERADLVISHAGMPHSISVYLRWGRYTGSGTILDVLRLGKPMIVIPNMTLLDNHQEELASMLANLGHLQLSTVL
jgi:beta-1,4-N-acetylglucosaminyltransferase